jgi:hypothetical protein
MQGMQGMESNHEHVFKQPREVSYLLNSEQSLAGLPRKSLFLGDIAAVTSRVQPNFSLNKPWAMPFP